MDQATAIQEGRARLKMSQEMLATAAGVSARTVIRAEQGVRVSGESLRAICSVVGLDATVLASEPTETDPSEPVAGGLGWHHRLLRLRKAPVMLLAILGFSALSLIPPAWLMNTVSRLDEPTRRLVEGAEAVATARYINAVAARIPDAAPPSPMVTEACMSGDAPVRVLVDFVSNPGSCPKLRREIRVERTDLGDGVTLLAAGPVGDGFARDVARRLSGDPTLEWRVAIGSGRQGHDLAWFDPRGIPPSDYPRSPGGPDAWLYVRLARSTLSGLLP